MYQQVQGPPMPSAFPPYPSPPPPRSGRSIAAVCTVTVVVVLLVITLVVLVVDRAASSSTPAAVTSTVTREPMSPEEATTKSCALFSEADKKDYALAEKALEGVPRASQRGGSSLYDVPGIWTKLGAYADAMIPIWVGVRKAIPLGTPASVRLTIEGAAQASIDIGNAYKERRRDIDAERQSPIYVSAAEALCKEST